MNTIFIENRCLCFSKVEEKSQAIKKIYSWTEKPEREIEIVLNSEDLDILALFRNRISSNRENYCFLFLCTHPKREWNKFISNFKIVEAGGGLVHTINNSETKYLYIYRRGFWDLPKGKKENNEDIACTSMREVMEETGLSNIHILGALPATFHFVLQNNSWQIKKCFWFDMISSKNNELPPLTPQTEEDIEKAAWLSEEQIKNDCNPMYPSIKLLTKYFFAIDKE